MVTACLTACPRSARPDALRTIVANAGKKIQKWYPRETSDVISLQNPHQTETNLPIPSNPCGNRYYAQRPSITPEDASVFLPWEKHEGPPLITAIRKERVIRALCSYFLAWVYNGYKGFSGYNRIQLMMLDDRKVPKWRQQKISQR
jgi:hypothetical protein